MSSVILLILFATDLKTQALYHNYKVSVSQVYARSNQGQTEFDLFTAIGRPSFLYGALLLPSWKAKTCFASL